MADAMPVDSSTVHYVNVLDVCNNSITGVDYYDRAWRLAIDSCTIQYALQQRLDYKFGKGAYEHVS